MTSVFNINGVNVSSFDEFIDIADKIQDSLIEGINALSEELGISEIEAGDIVYYRSRSRWCQQGEDRLLKYFKKGEKFNVMLDRYDGDLDVWIREE